MASNNNSVLWAALACIGVGILLLSDPNCKRGCRSVAEHLLTHGIDDLFSA